MAALKRLLVLGYNQSEEGSSSKASREWGTGTATPRVNNAVKPCSWDSCHHGEGGGFSKVVAGKASQALPTESAPSSWLAAESGLQSGGAAG